MPRLQNPKITATQAGGAIGAVGLAAAADRATDTAQNPADEIREFIEENFPTTGQQQRQREQAAGQRGRFPQFPGSKGGGQPVQEPVQDQPEIQPGRPLGDVSELRPSDSVQDQSELPVGQPIQDQPEVRPTRRRREPGVLRVGQQAIGRQRQRGRQGEVITDEDLIETPQRLPESERLRQQREQLERVQEEFTPAEKPAREFPTGEEAVVGRETPTTVEETAVDTPTVPAQQLPVLSETADTSFAPLGARVDERETAATDATAEPDLTATPGQDTTAFAEQTTGVSLDLDAGLEQPTETATEQAAAQATEEPPAFQFATGTEPAPAEGVGEPPGRRPPRSIRRPELPADDDDRDRGFETITTPFVVPVGSPATLLFGGDD